MNDYLFTYRVKDKKHHLYRKEKMAITEEDVEKAIDKLHNSVEVDDDTILWKITDIKKL